jgi:hypothetical protein
LRISGKLEGVQTPVTNGWVNVRVLNAMPGSGELMVWADYAPVAADGRFTVLGLPPGTLEYVAICDGFISQNPSGKATNVFVYPRSIDLPAAEEILVPMTESGHAEIRVLDPHGKPVEGADVGFWPNIQWANRWSTIFASDFYHSADTIHASRRIGRTPKRTFSTRTDMNGTARVFELPASQQSFAVEHPKWEVPITDQNRRTVSLRIAPGVTNYATVRLQPKGKQLREE